MGDKRRNKVSMVYANAEEIVHTLFSSLKKFSIVNLFSFDCIIVDFIKFLNLFELN